MKEHAYDAKRLGENIHEHRIKSSLTQAGLAQLADCSVSTISSLENGRCGISVLLLFRLAHALNCCPSELVKGV